MIQTIRNSYTTQSLQTFIFYTLQSRFTWSYKLLNLSPRVYNSGITLFCRQVICWVHFIGWLIASQKVKEEKWSYEFYYLSLVWSRGICSPDEDGYLLQCATLYFFASAQLLEVEELVYRANCWIWWVRIWESSCAKGANRAFLTNRVVRAIAWFAWYISADQPQDNSRPR